MTKSGSNVQSESTIWKERKKRVLLIDLPLGERNKTGVGDQSLSDPFITTLINVLVCVVFGFFFEVPYSAIMKLSVQIKDLQILFYWIAGLEGHQQNYVLSLTFFLLWLAFKLLLFKVLVTQWPFLGKTTYSFCFQWIYCCAYVVGAYGDNKLDLSFTLFSIQSIYSALKIC